jgi:hypothetical protein
VSHDDNDVGNKSPRRPGQPRIDQQNTPMKERPRICVAMAQQCADSGNQSAPQKLVHLVGCRDPKSWVRPHPVPQRS